jgi:hypothetical protein
MRRYVRCTSSRRYPEQVQSCELARFTGRGPRRLAPDNLSSEWYLKPATMVIGGPGATRVTPRAIR